ncbi:DUF5709 domain-containing protein [Actinomycetospora sp. TBRC 11914]|uniref:DUF5709 domain-containing protein n=1 Tax=Actinomycetospora sp. TBRC 11914 TaxID=2729387 RepID=UPI00145DB1FC|nr:DUF5709 domain-containing protein [Actinomycetospora sp. TBRC 11914]NMO94045.1 hypothetical protein [Actinomycetospora sp. TBRC 11914]
MTHPDDRESDAVPEEPDLGAAIQLESGETLDGPPGTDAMDALTVSPNRPFGLDDPDTTPEGQRHGETIDERLAREVPDDLTTTDGVTAGADPTADDLGSEAGQERAGRLTADETAPDTAATDVLDADDAGIAGGAAAAEEAAVHEIDEDELTAPGDRTAEGAGDDPDAAGPDVRLRGEDVDPARPNFGG